MSSKLTNTTNQTAYEATKIQTAYINSLSLQFGNKLRMVINKVVKFKERVAHLTNELKKKSCADKEIKLSVKSDIIDPITQLKLAISLKDINQIPKDFLDEKAIKHIGNFLSSYSKSYKFQKNSIYYDAVANPGKHLKAYFKLAEIYSKRSKFDKSLVWGKVVDLSSEAIKDQGPEKSIKFRGTIMTDGIGISIVKQNFGATKGQSSPKIKVVEEDFEYTENIPNEELITTEGKVVLVDPGRRDLLYCMHEDSTAKEKKVYRCTQNQKFKELKSTKFRKLCQRFKPASIQECENKLG
ncbi:hypothetical protein HPULCUR_009122 [Helicostylum pulchrum]|uniref:Uncharacterized protein n=1 Tax=Helicostylum pulchrum TaxID=562976 RepID=A0ABP9Y9J4_9FUNG